MRCSIRYKRTTKRGNALIEFSLLLPWMIFLFTAVFDFGFHAYAFISVENATRVAVLHGAANSTTASDQSGACNLVIEELRGLPNIGAGFTSSCNSAPLVVTASYCDQVTTCGSSPSADGGPAAVVTVTYQMPPLFRVPIKGLSSLTRTSEMRLRDELL